MKCEIITCPNCGKDVVKRTDEKTGESVIQAHHCTPRQTRTEPTPNQTTLEK